MPLMQNECHCIPSSSYFSEITSFKGFSSGGIVLVLAVNGPSKLCLRYLHFVTCSYFPLLSINSSLLVFFFRRHFRKLSQKSQFKKWKSTYLGRTLLHCLLVSIKPSSYEKWIKFSTVGKDSFRTLVLCWLGEGKLS